MFLPVENSSGASLPVHPHDTRGVQIPPLQQREKSVLVHEVLAGARVGDVELALGRTTRNGAFEASFNTSAQLDESGLVRRLLICRTPEISFD